MWALGFSRRWGDGVIRLKFLGIVLTFIQPWIQRLHCSSVTLVSIYLRIYTTPNPEQQYRHNRKGPTTLHGEMTLNDGRTEAMEGSGCSKHCYPRICIKGQNAARIADLRAESNPGPPEYEAGVITTRYQRWVGSYSTACSEWWCNCSGTNGSKWTNQVCVPKNRRSLWSVFVPGPFFASQSTSLCRFPSFHWHNGPMSSMS
jgi:hypothetical protein